MCSDQDTPRSERRPWDESAASRPTGRIRSPNFTPSVRVLLLTRRADALFELADVVLSADRPVWSLVEVESRTLAGSPHGAHPSS